MRLANKLFDENKVERFEWPPQSPDLNIIEHLWEELDRSVAKYRRKSIAEFRKGLYESWEQIGKELIDKLIESVMKRLKAVIDANGLNTKY